MPKSKPEKRDETKVEKIEMQEDETRSYASSPCSLHELDTEFWPMNPADELDDQLPEKSPRDTQEQD